MRRLTLRERDALPLGQRNGLSEEEAAAFAQLQPCLPAGALAWEHRAIRFGPFCGVLRADGVPVTPHDIEGLSFDRMICRWQPVLTAPNGCFRAYSRMCALAK